jgi:hypothetical protein
MEKTRATTSERDLQRTLEETDTEVKGDGPEITTTTAPIAKSLQDTKTTAIKEVIAEARDIEVTERRTIKSFPREFYPESITHHQKICSTDPVIYTQRSSMGSAYQGTQ